MAKNVRLGIIRARHDTDVAVISDQACIAMLMTGEHAVLKYWINTTHSHLDFIDSPIFPWVDVMPGTVTSRSGRRPPTNWRRKNNEVMRTATVRQWARHSGPVVAKRDRMREEAIAAFPAAT
jgi:hypothetical protein